MRYSNPLYRLIGKRGSNHEPEYLTARPAPTDGDFPLRKGQERALYRALCQRGRHILLYGPGGTGKTHMARKLFYRLSREYSRLAWVEYGSDIRVSMTAAQPDDLGDGPDGRFARFIRTLEAHPDTILFIDDVKADAMDDAILSQITGMDITILMTSRCPSISPYETWELEPLTNQECVGLFYANYKNDGIRKYAGTVLDIINRLERNVFAILLLANVAGEPANLVRISDYLGGGPLMDQIGRLLECTNLTDRQRQVLRCLSLMKSGEMDERLIRWFDFEWQDVQTLISKGWLTRNLETNSLVLHDLVREYFNREKPDPQTVETFIKGALGDTFRFGASQGASAKFKAKVLEFQLQALSLMEAYWESEEDLAIACGNIGMACNRYGDNWKALEYTQKALAIGQRVLGPDHPDLAVYYSNVGAIYSELGNHQQALVHHQQALEIQKKTLSEDDPNLAVSYNNISRVYQDLGKWQEALEYLQKAHAIWKRILPEDHPDLATSYNNLGLVYKGLKDCGKALDYLQRALAMREKEQPRNPSLLAQSYNNLGVIYNELGDYRKALAYHRKTLDLLERILPENHPNLAGYCHNMASVLTRMERYREALAYSRRSVAIAEESLPEDHPNLALFREQMTVLERLVRDKK